MGGSHTRDHPARCGGGFTRNVGANNEVQRLNRNYCVCADQCELINIGMEVSLGFLGEILPKAVKM